MPAPDVDTLLATLSCLPVFVTRIDAQDRVTFINHVMPGLDPTAVLGRNVMDFVAPAYQELALRTFASVRRHGEIATYSAVVGEPGTTLSYFENHVIPTPDVPWGLCILGIDVTQRDRSPSPDPRPPPQPRSFTGIDDGTAHWMWYPDDDQVVWNAAMHALVGHPEPLGPAAYLERCVHYEDAPLVSQRLHELKRAGSMTGVVHRIVRPDGRVLWVQATARNGVDEAGRRCLHGDLHDLGQPGDELRRLRANQRDRYARRVLAQTTERLASTFQVLLTELTELTATCSDSGRSAALRDCLTATQRATQELGRLSRVPMQPIETGPDRTDVQVSLAVALEMLPTATAARFRYRPAAQPALIACNADAVLDALQQLVEALLTTDAPMQLEVAPADDAARLLVRSDVAWSTLAETVQERLQAAHEALDALQVRVEWRN